jgi:tetratricopeptide (TPR) repeat protein
LFSGGVRVGADASLTPGRILNLMAKSPECRPVTLYLVDDVRIRTATGVLKPSAEVVFALALYLALEKSHSHSRRTIEELLWPGIDHRSAAHRLRQTLVKLRQIGVPVVRLGIDRLQLACEATLDIGLLVDPSRLTIDQLVGDLQLPLHDYKPSFSNAFADWVESKRHAYAAPLIDRFLGLVADLRYRGEWASVGEIATALLTIAPLNEEGTLALAEAYAMHGSKDEALRIIDTYLHAVGSDNTEMRLPAIILRKRIAERLPAVQRTEGYHAPFVGRGEIMASLSTLIVRTKKAQGSACLVWGEAGIGKSRLLSELANFAALQGMSRLTVSCRQSDRHRPLSIFVDLVPRLRNLRGAIGCSPETLRYLDRLTLHSSEVSEATEAGDADFVYARVQQAVFDLLDAVADEQPILIVVEDIHRLDEVSVSLITDLLPWIASRPIFFAFSARGTAPDWLDLNDSNLLSVCLPPLRDDDARQLISLISQQSDRSLSNDEADWCAASGEGNPYFLAELTRHLIEGGSRHAAPSSLSALIDERLGRLDSATLSLFQACALLDKNCSIERVEKVLGLEHYLLLRGIDELGAIGMLVLERTDAEPPSPGRLAPRHELLSLAAERALSPPASAYLHRRIGMVLEAEITDRGSTSVLWDCAKHWQRAGNSARAFSLARSCGLHLMKLGLCDAAAEAFRRSITYCNSDIDRLDILRGEASAYFGASDWERLATTERAVRQLQAYVEPTNDSHDDLELMALRGWWQTGKLDAVRERTLSCLQCEDATTTHRVRAGIMSLMLLDLACDRDAMRRTFALLQPLIDGPGVHVALRHEAKMVFEAACGDLPAAVAHADALIGSCRRSDNISDLTRALTNGSVAARTAGRLDLADAWLREALTIYEDHKLPLATAVPMQILASIALDENDLDSARQWHARLLLVPDAKSDSRAVTSSIGVRIALCEGKIAEARRLLKTATEPLTGDPNAHRRIYGLALMVAVQLAEGQKPDAALVARLESAHLVARGNTRQAFATFVLVSALRRRGNPAQADHLLREYCDKFRREPTPPPYHVLQLLDSFAN